jgi:hypothetical protein
MSASLIFARKQLCFAHYNSYWRSVLVLRIESHHDSTRSLWVLFNRHTRRLLNLPITSNTIAM